MQLSCSLTSSACADEREADPIGLLERQRNLLWASRGRRHLFTVRHAQTSLGRQRGADRCEFHGAGAFWRSARLLPWLQGVPTWWSRRFLWETAWREQTHNGVFVTT